MEYLLSYLFSTKTLFCLLPICFKLSSSFTPPEITNYCSPLRIYVNRPLQLYSVFLYLNYYHQMGTWFSMNGPKLLFHVFAWCFTSLMTVWCSTLSSQSFQLMTSIFTCPDSSLLPLTNLNPCMLSSLSLLPDSFSPGFWFSEVFRPSHLEDLGLARLLC